MKHSYFLNSSVFRLQHSPSFITASHLLPSHIAMNEAKLPIDSNGEKPIAAPVTIFRHRAARSKVNIKKRAVSPTGLDQSDSSSSSHDEVDTLSNARAKRRKYGTLLAASTIDKAQRQDHDSTTIRANRDVPPLSHTNDATKQRGWYDKPPKTGPIPMSNVRVTTIMDSKPDVCNDYQRTGRCVRRVLRVSSRSIRHETRLAAE